MNFLILISPLAEPATVSGSNTRFWDQGWLRGPMIADNGRKYEKLRFS